MDPLVSTDWLAARLSEVAVLDASWHMDGRDAEAEFRARRVPGARRFDIDAVADLDNPLPHTAPSPGIFAAAVAALGIGPATPVVIYDALGLFSAPRAWWTFRLMGHRDVAVLDGGPAEVGARGAAGGRRRPGGPRPARCGGLRTPPRRGSKG
jgi:thiosulfate/3-mercaptopyruvate sulfurtransferase